MGPRPRKSYSPKGWGPKGGGPKVGHRSTTAREPKRAHLRVPAFKNTTKIQREDPQRERKRAKMGAGEGKKVRNFGRSDGGGSGGGGPSGRGSGAGGPAQGVSGGGNEKKQKSKHLGNSWTVCRNTKKKNFKKGEKKKKHNLNKKRKMMKINKKKKNKKKKPQK